MAIFEEDEPNQPKGISIVTTPSGAKQVQNFDLNAARSALYDLDYSTSEAQEAIARRLAKETGFNINKAFDAGYSTEEVITKLTGIERVGLAPAAAQSFATNLAPGVAGGAGLAAGIAASKPLTMLTQAAPLPVKAAAYGLRGLTGLIGAGVSGGVVRDIQENVAENFGFDTEPQRLASDRPAEVAGETAAFFVGGIPGTNFLLRRIPEQISLGSLKATKNGVAGEVIYDATQIPLFRAKFGDAIAKGIVGMGRTAREGGLLSPKLVAPELASSGAASAGAFVAEAVDPEDDVTRFFAEVGTAAVSPLRIIGAVANPVMSQLKKIKGKFSPDARERSVADYLDETLRDLERSDSPVMPAYERGTRPDTLSQIEKAARVNKGLMGFRLTDEAGREIPFSPGQRSGSVLLMLLEKAIAQKTGNKALDIRLNTAAEQGIGAINRMAVALKEDGSNDALSAAAELEVKAIEGLLKHQADKAVISYLDYMNKLTRDVTPETESAIRRRASETAKERLGSLLNRAREVETDLYKNLPQNVTIRPTQLFKTLQNEFINNPKMLPGIRRLRPESVDPESMYRGILSNENTIEAEAIAKQLTPLKKQIQNLQQTVNKVRKEGDRKQLVERPDRRTTSGVRPEVIPVNIYDQVINDVLPENPTAKDFDEAIVLLERKDKRKKSTGGFYFGPTVSGVTGTDEKVLSQPIAQPKIINLGQRKAVIGLLKNQQKIAAREAEIEGLETQIQEILARPDEPGLISLGELRETRSALRELKNDALKDQRANEARAYRRLYQALSDDLLTSVGYRVDPQKGLTQADPEDVSELMRTPEGERMLQAFTYSYYLNEAFTRSFAGKLARTDRQGSEITDPELALQNLLGQNEDNVATLYTQLDDATTFLNRMAKQTFQEDQTLIDPENPFVAARIEASEEDAVTFNKAVADFLRAQLFGVTKVDQTVARLPVDNLGDLLPGRLTGESLRTISDDEVARFIQQNQAVFDLNPETKQLQKDLENPITRRVLQESLRIAVPGLKTPVNLLGTRTAFERNLRNNEGFGRLLKKNPSAAIADILNSNDPIKPREQLKSLIDFAKNPAAARQIGEEGPITGPSAENNLDAIRYGVVRYALDKARYDADPNNLNLAPFYDVFFKEGGLVGKNNPKGNLVDFLVEEGVVDKNFKQKVKAMSEAASNLNISRAFGLGEDELTLFLENNAIFSSIVARILGAKMGREVDAFAGKSTLQSPSIFSGVMNDFFNKYPNIAINDLLVEILSPNTSMNDFARIVGKTSKPEDKADAATLLGNLMQATMRLPLTITSSVIEKAENIYQDDEPQPLPPEPEPRPTAQVPLPEPQPQAPQPQPQAPSQPVNRAAYAAMFPEDIASGLIRQQNIEKGIGSLG